MIKPSDLLLAATQLIEKGKLIFISRSSSEAGNYYEFDQNTLGKPKKVRRNLHKSEVIMHFFDCFSKRLFDSER